MPVKKKIHTFDSDNSPISPIAIGDNVVRELEKYWDMDLPNGRDLAEAVADYAEGVYTHNERWRKQLQQKLKGDGQRGLAFIHTFARHWLTAELGKKHQNLVKYCLPPDFAVGRPPPENPNRQKVAACLRIFGPKRPKRPKKG